MLPGLEPAKLPADAIEVGRILDAWGIKGWFKVLPYSANPEALFFSKSWFLMPAIKGTKTFEEVGQLKIKEARHHSDVVVACTHEGSDRSYAEALQGARVFIARSNFPALKADEYYWVDLIGLEVVNREGLVLGRVLDLLSTGQQTVLVLNTEQEGESQQRMIPFVARYVDAVELSAHRILVDWQLDY